MVRSAKAHAELPGWFQTIMQPDQSQLGLLIADVCHVVLWLQVDQWCRNQPVAMGLLVLLLLVVTNHVSFLWCFYKLDIFCVFKHNVLHLWANCPIRTVESSFFLVVCCLDVQCVSGAMQAPWHCFRQQCDQGVIFYVFAEMTARCFFVCFWSSPVQFLVFFEQIGVHWEFFWDHIIFFGWQMI